jgi:flagella basal body P-ring formation protein FlgA
MQIERTAMALLGMTVWMAAGAATAAPPAAGPPASEQEIAVERIHAALLRHLEQHLPARYAEVRVQVLRPTEPITVPGGSTAIEVKAPRTEETVGRRNFDIAVTVDGKDARLLRVLAEVSAETDVVTTVRSIKPDETIQAEDVGWTKLRVPAVAADVVSDMEVVVGKRATMSLPANRPVRLAALALPYVIQRGDRVTIEARHGGLLIHAVGTSKGRAQVGQTVTVTNADSGKELRTKAVAPGLVRVEF